MATKKVTITLTTEQLAAVRRIVAAKRLKSVSGFVQKAIDTALQDAEGWAELLDVALVQTGGAPTVKEQKWAADLLSNRGRRKRAA